MLTNFNVSFSAASTDDLHKSWNEIYHITTNLLPHYRTKIKCSTAQLFSAVRLRMQQ